ncbi:hypothetical protein [Streptomyces montanus]|nr:hypothetical protein [Streptomyces montanus]
MGEACCGFVGEVGAAQFPAACRQADAEVLRGAAEELRAGIANQFGLE